MRVGVSEDPILVETLDLTLKIALESMLKVVINLQSLRIYSWNLAGEVVLCSFWHSELGGQKLEKIDIWDSFGTVESLSEAWNNLRSLPVLDYIDYNNSSPVTEVPIKFDEIGFAKVIRILVSIYFETNRLFISPRLPTLE